MSIFVDETTKVVIQGISPTSQGLFHGLRNKAYGTKIVGGTNPKRGGEEIEGIPVFASVAEAVKETGATASFISVPPRGAADAIIEAAEAGIAFIVCITEGIPAQDEAVAYNRLVEEFPGTRLLGPNCPGIISPGKCNIGITSGDIALAGGPVGIVSRSGTLTYQALHELSQQGIGQTTCVGIGGDPVPGTNFIDCLAAFEADPETKAVMNETLMPGVAGGMAAGGLDAAIVKVFAFDTSVVVLSKLATFTTALPAVADTRSSYLHLQLGRRKKGGAANASVPLHCGCRVEVRTADDQHKVGSPGIYRARTECGYLRSDARRFVDDIVHCDRLRTVCHLLPTGAVVASGDRYSIVIRARAKRRGDLELHGILIRCPIAGARDSRNAVASKTLGRSNTGWPLHPRFERQSQRSARHLNSLRPPKCSTKSPLS